MTSLICMTYLQFFKYCPRPKVRTQVSLLNSFFVYLDCILFTNIASVVVWLHLEFQYIPLHIYNFLRPVVAQRHEV